MKEQSRHFVPIIRSLLTTITSIFIGSHDRMAGFPLPSFHPPEGFIPTTVAVIPAMIGLRTPVSPPTDLKHQIRHMKLNGIIGLLITHLKGLQTLNYRQSVDANNNWKFADSNLPRYNRQCLVSRVVSSE